MTGKRPRAPLLSWSLVPAPNPGSGPGAGPGYDYLAPNVRRFRENTSSTRRGFAYFQAALALALVSFLLTFVVGALTLVPRGPGAEALPAVAFWILGGLAFFLQGLAVAVGADGEMFLSSPDPEVFPDLAGHSDEGDLWFGLAAAALAVGGTLGFALTFPEGLVRLHPGPALTPYGPDNKIVLNAVAWGASGAAFSLLFARGLYALTNPYLGPRGRARWPLFFVLVAAASGVSVVLTLYGIYFLGGDNPAGLGSAISAASVLVLWAQVSEAKASIASRPEPAPAWPPPPMVGWPALTYARALDSPPLQIPAPQQPPVPGALPPPPAAFPPSAPQPPVLPPGLPPQASSAPALCPRCRSTSLAYAYPPAREFSCRGCGLVSQW